MDGHGAYSRGQKPASEVTRPWLGSQPWEETGKEKLQTRSQRLGKPSGLQRWKTAQRCCLLPSPWWSREVLETAPLIAVKGITSISSIAQHEEPPQLEGLKWALDRLPNLIQRHKKLAFIYFLLRTRSHSRHIPVSTRSISMHAHTRDRPLILTL